MAASISISPTSFFSIFCVYSSFFCCSSVVCLFSMLFIAIARSNHLFSPSVTATRQPSHAFLSSSIHLRHHRHHPLMIIDVQRSHRVYHRYHQPMPPIISPSVSSPSLVQVRFLSSPSTSPINYSSSQSRFLLFCLCFVMFFYNFSIIIIPDSHVHVIGVYSLLAKIVFFFFSHRLLAHTTQSYSFVS